ncbi:hypothetical protein O9G_002198 [Rozella allomycis CSF55]|uniref:Uncharacterized protein n=1 Tax=Rozella allomycis (strain CSF55) TaxID=988480 RepID=A0A075AQ70_ROZAC|nr:hypothetical protein O9G_002198 [Rozella allomycis CSF55]|eukprot:EPZ32358.1 hypothetical protein O9G_002198 [Rozella allomycis CSF55]
MIITKINFRKLTTFDYSLFTAAAMYLFGSIMPILMAFDVATPKKPTDTMKTEYLFFVVSSVIYYLLPLSGSWLFFNLFEKTSFLVTSNRNAARSIKMKGVIYMSLVFLLDFVLLLLMCQKTDLREYLMLRQGRRLCCTFLVTGYSFTYVLILKELSKLEKTVQEMSKNANSQVMQIFKRMLKFGKISMISLIVNTATTCVTIILEVVCRNNLGVQIGLIVYDCISLSTGMLALSSKAETSVIPKLFEEKAVMAEIDSIRHATLTHATASVGGAESQINR